MKFSLFRKKHQFHRLNISEVIHSKKFSYFNAKKQLFQNTFREWTWTRVPNTAQILLAALLLQFSNNPKQIEF